MLFAKRPRAGRVKTRLVPPLTVEQALRLYTAFVEDQLRFLASMATPGRHVELAADGPWEPTDPSTPLSIVQQGPGDLGERMHRAFARSHAAGTESTVIVGADSPTLPASRVEAALGRLSAGASAVVSPADDGGYVLIGMGRPVHELFSGVPWGGPEVMAVSRERAHRAAVDLAEIDGWYDVDDTGGLLRLRRELQDEAARERAPATARYMRTLDQGGVERIDGAS